MLCLSIVRPGMPAGVERADLLEFRFDLIGEVDLELLSGLPREKLVFTRPPRMPELFALAPAYCDVGEDLELARMCHPSTKVIRSRHLEGPGPLTDETKKLAVTASSSVDALRMVEHVRKTGQIGVCMGEDGLLSRVLGPAYGAPWTYVAAAEGLESAPGQPTLELLLDLYRVRRITQKTRLFGLIGGKVSHSRGMRFHNDIFVERGIDGVYLPLRLDAGDLGEFFEQMGRFPFGGLSVTMPLKQVVMGHLKGVTPYAESCGAVNTVDANFVGHNTDGPGALDAIEEHLGVRGKRVVVLGAGGAGLAIAHEARERGAEVMHLNRTPRVGIEGLEKMPSAYDVLVQATCVDEALVIEEEAIRPDAVVLEVISRETEFERVARKRGCRLVPGEAMFRAQGHRQQEIWNACLSK